MLTLKHKLATKYDKENPLHEETLLKLWKLSFPSTELQNRISNQWKELGFQGNDPATDFRGGGFFGLALIVHFAEKEPIKYQKYLEGKHHSEPYPMAISALNIQNMIYELLGLGMKPQIISSSNRKKLIQYIFISTIDDSEENINRFKELYIALFSLLDSTWATSNVSTLLDFPRVLESTRTQFVSYLEKSMSFNELITRINNI